MIQLDCYWRNSSIPMGRSAMMPHHWWVTTHCISCQDDAINSYDVVITTGCALILSMFIRHLLDNFGNELKSVHMKFKSIYFFSSLATNPHATNRSAKTHFLLRLSDRCKPYLFDSVNRVRSNSSMKQSA